MHNTDLIDAASVRDDIPEFAAGDTAIAVGTSDGLTAMRTLFAP